MPRATTRPTTKDTKVKTTDRQRRGPTRGAKSIDRMIQDWLASLPTELRAAPHSTEEITRVLPSLSGRAVHPRAADVAAALHRMGWMQKRTWRGVRYFRIWVPTISDI